MNWTDYYIQMARVVANKSKDESTKVGCIIVGHDKEIRATGFNGFPRGVNDDADRYADRNTKLLYIVHAEANAVAAAARVGVSLKGCTAVVTKFPCSQCAALLIQAGVTKVMAPSFKRDDRWIASNRAAETMFTEAKVSVETYFPGD